jgi:hypothetical protein
MCTEKDPAKCHRTILVGRQLGHHGITVHHILASGEVDDHDTVMRRLAHEPKLDTPDLFRSDQDQLDLAYSLQEDCIAYRNGEQEQGEGLNP